MPGQTGGRAAGPLAAARAAALKPALDRVYDAFDRTGRVADPVDQVRQFESPADAEIAGFLAAGLSFGRVKSILAAIEAVLAVMRPSPAAFVRAFEPGDAARFDGFVHRWVDGGDLAGVVWILRHMLRTAGSIERYFADGDDPTAADITPGLEAFSRRARQVDLAPLRQHGATPGGAHRFFPRPSAGSACKRLNLFLRWMVRRDAIDLGLWSRVSPARLVLPLDVHVIRVGKCLGLTRYATPGWRMAADMTRALRAIDPDDPVRYDFALCHVGMLELCGFRRPEGDARCPLRGVCQPRSRRRRSWRRPSDPP